VFRRPRLQHLAALLLIVLMAACSQTHSAVPDGSTGADGPAPMDVQEAALDVPDDGATLPDADPVAEGHSDDARSDSSDVVPRPCESAPSEVLEAATNWPAIFARTAGGCVWRWDYSGTTDPPAQWVSASTLVPGLRAVRSLSWRLRLFVVADSVARHVAPSNGSDPPIADIPDAVEVVDAHGGMCAILSDRSVRCSGTLSSITYARPTPVDGVRDARRLAGLDDTLLASLLDGRVMTWSGDLRARAVPSLAGATDFGVGHDYLCVRMSDGTVRCAGNNQYHVCSPSSRASYSIDEAVAIEGLRDITQVAAANWGAAYALRSDGRLLRWGRIRLDFTYRPLPQLPTPELVPDLTDVVRIAGGINDLLAVRRDGSVWSLHTPSLEGVPTLARVAGFGPP